MANYDFTQRAVISGFEPATVTESVAHSTLEHAAVRGSLFRPIAQTRAVHIKRLSDQANTISALLSVVHILDEGCRVDALLDCASLANNFIKDLNAFVGVAA